MSIAKMEQIDFKYKYLKCLYTMNKKEYVPYILKTKAWMIQAMLRVASATLNLIEADWRIHASVN